MLFLWVLLVPVYAQAQLHETVYRPDVDWKEINTERFRVIFPATAEPSARRALRILESEYEDVQELVGGELSGFPVVLNDYNDRTGGLVTTNHFRMEVEVPPRRGKNANPKTGGWLERVMPHELVHALHFSVAPPYSLSRLLRPIAPDLAPTIHFTAPLGLAEGIAVYHESNVRPGESGRGNLPFFTNQIRANFISEDRWSVGELMYPSSRTRPGGRHYFGGYTFTDWLHNEYGADTTRELIARANQWFFLGYGLTLRTVTGKWPRQLENDFFEHRKQIYQTQLDSLEALGYTPYEILDTGLDGALLNRPVFLSDDDILFYGSFYNERSGLWKTSLTDGEQNRIYTGTMVDNNRYSVTDDYSVLFSRQVTHPYHHNTWTMDVFELDPVTETVRRISEEARGHNPQLMDDGISVLQTHRETSQWVRMNEGEVTDTLLSLYPDHIHEVMLSPQDNRAALVANINGKQALWLTEPETPEIDKTNPDLALRDGSIYDIAWHPDEQKLLFTGDRGGEMEIFEWDITTDRVRQITNTRFNVMEPAYHPEGDSIAVIVQKSETQQLALLRRSDFFDRPLAGEQRITSLGERVNRSRVGDDQTDRVENTETESYSTGAGWLRPRAVFPIAELGSTFPEQRFGASVSSGDVLRRNRYALNVSYGGDQFWYEASYQRRSGYPGFGIHVFSTPAVSGDLGLQEQGARISTEFPYTLQHNLFQSRIAIEPSLRYVRRRAVYHNELLDEPTDWFDEYRASVRLSGHYRLQQNLQDMQPNTGFQFYNQWYGGYTEEISGRPEYAVAGGVFGYFAPLLRFNQSLRTGVEFLVQEGIGINQSYLLEPGFSIGALPDPDRALRLSNRYTIPLVHADRAWLTFPSQLQTIYAVLYSNTLAPMRADPDRTQFSQSRSVYGTELRVRFNLFNLTVDSGVRIGYEPTRENWHLSFVL